MVEHARVHDGSVRRSIGATGDDDRESIFASAEIARFVEQKSIHSDDDEHLGVGAAAQPMVTPYRGMIRTPQRWRIEGRTMLGYGETKDEYRKRLRRIEGQVRGLQAMIDEDRYCIDILTQISASTRALQSVALALIDDHLSHCVREAIDAGGPEADAKVAEASAAIARLVRS